MNKKQILFLADFIRESDLIEGISDNHNVLQNQLIKKHPKGHVGAILCLEPLSQEKKRVLDHDLVCQIQGLITAEQHMKPGGPRLRDEFIGHYRTVEVSIGGRPGCPAERVKESMGVLIEQIVRWQKNWSRFSLKKNVVEIADFHFDFEDIHPFADGNGRTGRALVYYLFRWVGAEPFVFTHHDKFETYYPAFRAHELMEQYFLKRCTNND